jgi:hypothetical protein
MQEIATLLGGSLKINENKITLEDSKDIDLVIQIFCDYVKIGELSGNKYKTYSGKIINN